MAERTRITTGENMENQQQQQGKGKCPQCGNDFVGKKNPTSRRWNVDGKWVCEPCKVGKEKGKW